MERAILELLADHDWLVYEQVAELAGERPKEVRETLERLRERGLVNVLPVGVLEGPRTRSASYWRLTEDGRAAVRGEPSETLEQRAREARQRSAQAYDRAQAAHERAAVLHKPAADFQQRRAQADAERPDANP